MKFTGLLRQWSRPSGLDICKQLNLYVNLLIHELIYIKQASLKMGLISSIVAVKTSNPTIHILPVI